MDKIAGKNKTDQKAQVKPDPDKKNVKEHEEPLRLTADLEGNYLLDERTSDLQVITII